MDIQCVHYSGAQSPSFLFVPGFFTEPLVPGSPLDLSWDRQVVSISKTYRLNGYIVRWPAGNIKDISMFRHWNKISSTLESTLVSWCAARDRTNAVVNSLLGHIQTLESPVHLAGHSLGGRIVLKVAEAIHVSKKIQSIAALAPAVSAPEVDLGRVSQAVEGTPFVCYSSKDKVLSTLFPCGQQSFRIMDLCRSSLNSPKYILQQVSQVLESLHTNPAIGFVGVPNEYRHLFRSKNTQLSHLKYASNLKSILRESRNLDL